MNARFNLETPGGDRLDTITRFSGWYIPDHGRRPHLYVSCNGKREATLEWGSIRPDVSSVYPSQSRSIVSGFQGDVLVGEYEQAPELEVAVFDAAGQGRELFRRRYAVGPYHPPTLRDRSFTLFDLLVCSECRSPLAKHEMEWACLRCGVPIPVRRGVPHFLQAEGTPCLHLSEQTNTHPYSSEVLDIIECHRAGLVLDFGAGHTPRDLLRPHVVYLDAVQYQWTDLVCTRGRLPFRDQTFGAVVSQAVFEHLEDPHLTARELCRILRPGGIIHLDTAFMQPLHGDPWHFFNMTQHGLRKVMAPFEEIRCGIKSYQHPSASLLMQFDAIAPFLRSKKWRNTVARWRKELQTGAGDFDDALGEVGRTTLAAGFYFEGRRPQ
ncbi:MAG: hypothetical protein OJF47_003963 [Nitrospira sp.]|jgi:uncharacterized protein YbaR (Trm112 family)|nr:MAG: hypothetical protein OJF47_003963 [Nitrospira sp.]